MQDARQQQAGGISIFLVIGLVLAALLGGAIYFSKQQGRAASNADTVATNGKAAEGSSSGAPQNEAANGSTSDGTSSPAAPTPAPEPTPTQPAAPATSASDIAITGPADVIVPALGLASVAAGAVYYRRSYVAIRAEALKQ